MVVLGYLTPPVVLDHPRLVVAGRAGSDDTFTRELVVRVTHDSYPAITSTSDTRTFEYGGPSIDELQNSGSELAILGSNFGTIGRWAWGRGAGASGHIGTLAIGRVPQRPHPRRQPLKHLSCFGDNPRDAAACAA